MILAPPRQPRLPEMPKHVYYVDLTGRRFGALTVIERTRNKRGRMAWRCRCECGGENTYVGSELTGGLVVSCGCSRRRYLAGSYCYTMDTKGRVVLPMKLLGELSSPFWITRGKPGYLLLLPDRELPKYADRWLPDPDKLLLHWTALSLADVDATTGRFLIPLLLRDWIGANARQNPEIVISGAADAVVVARREVWDADLMRAAGRTPLQTCTRVPAFRRGDRVRLKDGKTAEVRSCVAVVKEREDRVTWRVCLADGRAVLVSEVEAV